MRKVKCFDLHGTSVQEILDEFNERREEFGVPDKDIISLSSGPPRSSIKIHNSSGPANDPTVSVTIFYWSDA